MKLFLAFFRLVRGVNLLFIALTQYLFQYCIVAPTLNEMHRVPVLSGFDFLCIVLASISIAAGGNVINDYFDINIDTINKPERNVVDAVIGRRWAIFWHLFLSFVGIALTFYIAHHVGISIGVGILNMVAFGLLWTYSTTFKKKLLSGNIMIALLTAWVILILYWFEMEQAIQLLNREASFYYLSKLFKLSILYAGFAFIITLIREVVKDIEDRQGDLKYGCKTMPIVLGMQVTKVFTITWIVVLIAGVTIVQLYTITFQWWYAILYTFFFVIIPLFMLIVKLQKAIDKNDFHKMSQWIKGIMLAGILSMLFFKFYV